MFISIIIPVYNSGDMLTHCLQAVNKTLYDKWECIVVNDGSTDGSADVAARLGARIINLKQQQGPALARNVGAQAAEGDVLFFIDADVLVQPGTVGYVAATLTADPTLAACFGSYDDAPTQKNFLSQYRNLLHHYVHQHSHSEASTFWSGCGAIRRSIFLETGGFSVTAFSRPSIEDIELGYRLCAAGYQIRLEKLLQVRHMKRWTPRQMVVTDVRDRAIPWSRLILQGGGLPNDLNLQTTQRLSTMAAFIGLLGVGLMLFRLVGLLLAVTAVSTLLWLNRDFYQFLRQKRGTLFMLAALPWHWFYFLYSGASFLLVFSLQRAGKLDKMASGKGRPLSSLSTLPKATRSAEDVA